MSFEGREYGLQEFVNAVSAQLGQLRATLNTTQQENEALQEQVRSSRPDADASFNRSMLAQDINLSLVGTLPTFSGENHDEHVTPFLDSIASAGDISGWRDKDKIKICILKLTGNARAFAASNDECRAAVTFESFRQALKDRFAKRLPDHYYYDQLAMARQNKSEKIEDFADRVHHLCMRTIRHTESEAVNRALREEAERRALDAFLKGLVGKVGENTRIKFPQTLKEAVVVALNLNNLERLTTKEVEPLSSRKVFVNETAHVGRNSRTKETQRCFSCDKVGHYASECRGNSSRNTQRCFKCDKIGHRANECRGGSASKLQRCYRCDQPGHYANTCRGNPSGENRPINDNGRGRKNETVGRSENRRDDIKCYTCGRRGHIQRDCRMQNVNPNIDGVRQAAGDSTPDA